MSDVRCQRAAKSICILQQHRVGHGLWRCSCSRTALEYLSVNFDRIVVVVTTTYMTCIDMHDGHSSDNDDDDDESDE